MSTWCLLHVSESFCLLYPTSDCNEVFPDFFCLIILVTLVKVQCCGCGAALVNLVSFACFWELLLTLSYKWLQWSLSRFFLSNHTSHTCEGAVLWLWCCISLEALFRLLMWWRPLPLYAINPQCRSACTVERVL